MAALLGYNARVLPRTLRAPWSLGPATAIVSAVVAFGLTLLLQLRDRPFLLPVLAVLASALRGGFAAGLLCAGVTLILVNRFISPPAGRFGLPSLADAYDFGVFALTAALISLLAARRREAELTLEATLASIGDGVIVTDEDGRVMFLNRVAEKLTGWTFREAANRHVTDVYATETEDTRRRAGNPIERALSEGTVVALGNHAMLIARDGSEQPIADSAAPITDANGRTLGAVLVFRDASIQRNAEEALKQQAEERQQLLERERSARAEAERANRLKDEFLATLSHELRTPLNAVLGWSQMLTRRHLTAEQQKQALAAIHRNAQSQARIVDEVLDLSRIVTGRLALTSEPVDLTEIVRTTVQSFNPAVLARRQQLRLDLAPEAEVAGDPHRLRQIVWNLLSNATKFTPEGGTIMVRVSAAQGHVELTVTDNGQGIDHSFLPYVFDRFRQADSSTTRGHGGLGLGLALVRELVEAHGGTAAAMSDGLGKGTTLRLTFPAHLRQASPPDPVASDLTSSTP